MRILAIDYGQARCGLAISDPLLLTAQPLKTVSPQALIAEILQINKDYEINEILLGLPLQLNGKEGIAAKNIKELARKIEAETNLKVSFIDERMSSKTIEKTMISNDLKRDKRKKNIDKIVATYLLQSYLDKIKKETLAADLGGSTLRLALINARATIDELIVLKRKYHQDSFETPEKLVNLIVESIADNPKFRQVLFRQSVFVISIAGPVSQDQRTAIFMPNIFPDLNNIEFAKLLEAAIQEKLDINKEVFLLNDGFAGAIAEMDDGSVQDADFAMSIIVGTGLGGVAVERKQNDFFKTDFFLEPGHLSYDKASKKTCKCGNVGCYELFTAGSRADIMAKENLSKSEYNLLRGKKKQIDGYLLMEALKDERKELVKQFLIIMTKALADLILKMQIDAQKTRNKFIKIVLIGGFALGLGQEYLDALKLNILKLNKYFQATELIKILDKISLGQHHPDQTNLYGVSTFIKRLK